MPQFSDILCRYTPNDVKQMWKTKTCQKIKVAGVHGQPYRGDRVVYNFTLNELILPRPFFGIGNERVKCNLAKLFQQRASYCTV